ncbi:MAG: transposase [Cyanobacteria bacterium J06648_10]
MSPSTSVTTEYRPEAIETAVERVVAFGRSLLADAPEELLGIVERQSRQLLKQRSALQAYEQQIKMLEAQVGQLKEGQFVGSVAPFRIDEKKRKQVPKKPGRKPGHRGEWRQAPPPAASDEHLEVSLAQCPDCGYDLDVVEQRAIEQTIIEAPVVVPRIIRLRTYRNHCEHCDKPVSSHHPLQVSRATGAAGTHLGPRVLGLAAMLNKDLKLTMRKSTQVLNQLLGVTLSPGGLSQALDRVAKQLKGGYEQVLATLRESEVIHTDETGWWVNGSGYTLWVYTNQDGTYYRIVDSRNRATAEAILGHDFNGVLVSDCLSIYDGIEGEQQKCYAHHLKALSKALHSEDGKAQSTC